MENRYCVLKAQLDELGYKHPLSPESVPLVEKLLWDLVKTTENLQEYKSLAQSAIEERDHLELGAEPFKCDNAKLVQECNELHTAFMHFREQTDGLQRDLKNRINILEKEKERLLERQKKLKEETKKPSFKRTISSKSSLLSSGKSLPKKEVKTKGTEDLENMMTLAEQRIANLAKEVKKLKTDHNQHLELIDDLQHKLKNREKEISRLSTLLEGGRPLPALSKDCCYKDMGNKISQLAEELESMRQTNSQLDMQLAHSIARQHEAMKRALQLADKNKMLEKELHDIDKMALFVEKDCDNKVRTKAEQLEFMRLKFSDMKEKLDASDDKIDDLERQLIEARRKIQTLDTDVDILTDERDKIKIVCESSLHEKKKLTDHINQLSRIEHDLNCEIDRLVEVSTLQKRKICELECAAVDQTDQVSDRGDMSRKQPCYDRDITQQRYHKLRNRRNPCDEICDDENIAEQIAKLKEQKDYYYTEWKLLKQKSTQDKYEDVVCLKRRLEDRECKIEGLQQEIREMVREKQNLISRMEQLQEIKELSASIEADGMSAKNSLSRAEKERDLARADVRRLEIERDALRERMRITAETNVVERTKLERIVQETEDKLRQLESERRELVTVQGARRASINHLEAEVDQLTKKLHSSQQELARLNTLYAQVRALHDQTDRALSDTQAQNSQFEMEYSTAQEKIVQLERERAEADTELGVLRNDLAVLKTKLATLDSDKDQLVIELDGKTEQLQLLEHELKTKDARLAHIESQFAELQQQMQMDKAGLIERERIVRELEGDLNVARREAEREANTRCSVSVELRRAQDELTSAHSDLRRAQTDLDQRVKEADDLRRQLQEYVHEVRRIEEMLGEKERERKQLLEQFCSLSHEATQLETTNHSLERGTVEARAQLGDALEESGELRCKLEAARSLCSEYEQQIERLTQRIAQLECQRVGSNRVDQLEQLLMLARQQNIEARVREEEREREIRRLRCLCERLSGGSENIYHPGSGSDAGIGDNIPSVLPPVPAPRHAEPLKTRYRDVGISVGHVDTGGGGTAKGPASAPALSLYTANFSVSNQDSRHISNSRTPSPRRCAQSHDEDTSPSGSPRHRNAY